MSNDYADAFQAIYDPPLSTSFSPVQIELDSTEAAADKINQDLDNVCEQADSLYNSTASLRQKLVDHRSKIQDQIQKIISLCHLILSINTSQTQNTPTNPSEPTTTPDTSSQTANEMTIARNIPVIALDLAGRKFQLLKAQELSIMRRLAGWQLVCRQKADEMEGKKTLHQEKADRGLVLMGKRLEEIASINLV